MDAEPLSLCHDAPEMNEPGFAGRCSRCHARADFYVLCEGCEDPVTPGQSKGKDVYGRWWHAECVGSGVDINPYSPATGFQCRGCLEWFPDFDRMLGCAQGHGARVS